MKVLFFIHDFGVGGAETITAKNIEKLLEKGVDVAVVVNKRVSSSHIEQKLVQLDVPIFSLKPNKKESLLSKILRRTCVYRMLFWNKVLKKVRPDIIHINTSLSNFPKRVCLKYPVVFSFHTDVERHLRIFGKKEKRKMVYCTNQKMAFFAISNKIENDIRFYFPNASVFLVPNGIDISTIRKNKYSKEKFLIEHNIPKDSFIVGHVGRFNKVKNHKKVLGVFKEIHDIDKNSYLVLVGGGNEDETKTIVDIIDALELRNYVIMLGIRSDATSIMGVFDLLLLPSITEGFPLVMIEAQSLGVKCVASTGVPEDVICTSNSIRIDLSKSDREWARIALSDNKNDTYNAIQNYDINKVINDMLIYYTEIIKARGL